MPALLKKEYGDLNGDGTVNIFDLGILLGKYGTSDISADVNNDGAVNVFDLGILLGSYGVTTPPGTSSSPWAWNATNATLDPNSSSLMSNFLGYALNFPNFAMTNYAVATADSKAGDPSYAVPLTSGGKLDASGFGRSPITRRSTLWSTSAA